MTRERLVGYLTALLWDGLSGQGEPVTLPRGQVFDVGCAAMDWPLRFGIFLAPFHPVGQNPTLALERDLDLIEHLDSLGFDEAWSGEHHSAGYAILPSPEVFIPAAPQPTKPTHPRHRVSPPPPPHP